ncbi:uncharacterized protein LOC102715729 isoform X2 [Oryza brachyantha]|uniref:uncharacterized protein LOC102715729 isoform X2 n=1 Tax=Oryza brachyantha TaxID=4533 RepID=UPI000776223E|nr:uncharacterized protein LOC102715729 isoform X2 [Oryza brachyantha]
MERIIQKKGMVHNQRESKSEDDGLDVDMGDNEPEEEPEHEPEVDVRVRSEQLQRERQLSKKELRKEELAELDTVLAELGISGHATQPDAISKSDRKPDEQNDGDKNGAPSPSESKTSKLKKRNNQRTNQSGIVKSNPMKWIPARIMERQLIQKHEEENRAVDVREKMKKITATKKKRSIRDGWCCKACPHGVPSLLLQRRRRNPITTNNPCDRLASITKFRMITVLICCTWSVCFILSNALLVNVSTISGETYRFCESQLLY